MYAKLVLRNAKRSIKDYLIYIVTLTICVTLFYSFLSISSRFYHPAIGVEYNLTMLSGNMKIAICAVTLLLFFLISYVNCYMIRRKQKEFAIQTVMGMEQRTTAWLFFTETMVMGMLSIGAGIILGMLCSQFVTAMLLSSFGQSYRLSWMLFPDTFLLTVCVFMTIFFLIGLQNVNTIRKIKIIDMLNADKIGEGDFKKSRWMPVISVLYGITLCFMLVSSVITMHEYSDPRLAFPVHVMYWGNILAPAISLVFLLVWSIGKNKNFDFFVFGWMLCSLINACLAACVPWMRMEYFLAFDKGTINKYLDFLLTDLFFLICAIFYLSSGALASLKEKSLRKYRGENLFFFGQILSKLKTTTKTMTLICLTLVLSIFLFVSVPALVGWATGYLNIRSVYDVQISTQYNDVYSEADLPTDNYELVTDFLQENDIKVTYDCTFNLYLPKEEEFTKRMKYDFPAVAISLSDYNYLREMCGYEPVSLKEDEFTTQWQATSSEDECSTFLKTHPTIETDAGVLHLSTDVMQDVGLGETIYNSYTNVVYVFPDSICDRLLPVMRNRYVNTAEPISFVLADKLEKQFYTKYSEIPEGGEGNRYFIRTSTNQINETKASIFVLQASMTYGAIVLLIICFTILSLQQLSDAVSYKYRFGVLRKIGVEQGTINQLILRQLGVWFGMPVAVAILVSIVLTTFFFNMISVQITTYIGASALFSQVASIVAILALLLLCYFISTWILFKRTISE